MTDQKPLLCLDFDGVCHLYTSPWQGPHVVPDPPVAGLFEFLTEVMPFFDVEIYSSRSAFPGGIGAMQDWFQLHGEHWLAAAPAGVKRSAVWERLGYPLTKPSAFVTLDDRALHFTGIWPELDALRAFRPWNRS